MVGRTPHGGAPAGWLDLSANLNPLGPPLAVVAAIATANYGNYASLDPSPAEERLACDSGVEPTRVVVTAGATEALRLVTSLFLPRRGRLLVVGPTYGEYHRLGLIMGAAIREVRADPPLFDPPIDAAIRMMDDFRPHLVLMCDPNNPTGRSIEPVDWRRLIDAVGSGRLVVDESFAPFRGQGAGAPLDDDRLVAVRSLTKLHAIPGVRVGFVVAASQVATSLRSVIDPWSVGSHALVAAAAGGWGLDDGARRTIAAWRTDLARTLQACELTALQSDANFVLVAVRSGADAFVAALAIDRVAVRNCISFGINDYVRIAVPEPGNLQRLATALERADPRGG
ncbi:MAG: pyridoxal phosphate-dependent aminotransferase [Candidatus Limnocylindria bacterium]